jgi:hypothetical protein
MLTLRTWHSYLGIFIAPSVIFFALTGALQLFSLHEAHGSYHPPAVLEQVGSLHKDLVFSHDHHNDGPPPGAGEGGEHHEDAPPRAATLVLKSFLLFVSLGLAASTGMGLWIGLSHHRRKRVAWGLLAAGVAIPALLLLL